MFTHYTYTYRWMHTHTHTQSFAFMTTQTANELRNHNYIATCFPNGTFPALPSCMSKSSLPFPASCPLPLLSFLSQHPCLIRDFQRRKTVLSWFSLAYMPSNILYIRLLIMTLMVSLETLYVLLQYLTDIQQVGYSLIPRLKGLEWTCTRIPINIFHVCVLEMNPLKILHIVGCSST